MESCIICKDACLKEFVNVGPKGRITLVAASLERQDGLHEQLQAQDPLVLHIACRKAYIRKSTIKSEKRKSEISEPDEEVEAPILRAQTSSFNIATQCLFCSEELITSHKIEIKRRKIISNVETIEFKENVIKRAKERGDEWGEEVVNLIEASIDLVAAEGKYHRACAQKFFSKSNELKPLGKPVEIKKSEAFDKVCAYIDENDECQYTVSDLMEQMETFLDGEEGYSLKYFKQKLRERYKDDIIITSIHGKTSIVSFRESAHRILREKFVMDKAMNKGFEDELIIEMAASIIRDDIRMSVYDVCEYPTLEETENGSSMVPESLKLFLHKLLDPMGKNPNLVSRKSIAIAHSLISACRPRSFISPVLLAISVYIHRKYASRELIDILSSLGFADDYREVRRFENSLMTTGEPSYNLSGFTQFVFDNADFNVATLTGHNTFHAMGGIACVTPPAAVEKPPVKRILKVPPAAEVGSFGHVPIKTYRKLVVPALQSVTVEPLQISDSHRLQVTTFDSIWMLGYILKVTPCLPWSGFMKTVLSSDDFHTSRIETLPFINLDPGNLSTIYTALSFAQTQCEKHGLKICPVTFDQPLYQKASEIVAASADLDRVIVRIGGFHLLMSYLGSIGHIMAGSGLEELWERVYAKGSVVHMLTGHAFSRAVRAHILTLLALINVLLQNSEWEAQTNKDHLTKLYQDTVTQIGEAAGMDDNESLRKFQQFLTQELDQAASKSRTGKLWVQYIQQVLLMLDFIKAERTGNWHLHLHCVQKMIPYFHAAGHLPYAKSARLYLQQMNSIADVMPYEEYTLFSAKGYFTIRRSNDFWSGNFSDQTIEQFLMRMLKAGGGMTHGRGITDSTLTKWVHAMPHCLPVCNALEKFAGVHACTSEQHRDLRQSTQRADTKDYNVFCQWLETHPPFAGYQTDRLVSISTGVVADKSINADDALQIGQTAASKITGKQFTEITLHRSDKVKTMGDKIRIRGQTIAMNPTLFFNRITCVLKTSSDMEQFLSYELSHHPPSLFQDGAMRKPTKSALGTILKSFAPVQKTIPADCQYVIDGGHLLQSVVWPSPASYGGVCQCYVTYVKKHYGTGTTIVFDGYRTISTKATEQMRRAKKTTSSDILFDKNMQTTTTQAAFLANNNNKGHLIQMLTGILIQVGIQVKQAEADADSLIVSTALSLAECGKPVVVVGTDTDLLVMLVTLASTKVDMYMLCCKNPTALYRVQDIQEGMGSTSRYLMALHAITGCDTVSALYRQGKRKAFNLVHNNNDYAFLDIFMNKHSTHQQIQEAGESFLLKLYGARSCESLNQLRYIAYNKAIGRTSLSSTFQLASLPPTSAAAKQHSYRSYLTVQEWMGRSLQPTAWGWRLEDILTPVETDQPIAPDTLLNMISCGCRADGCGVSCGCRKMGVNCSALCSKCIGQTCNNAAPVHLLMDIEGDPEESTLISPQHEIDDEDECDDE